MPKLPAAKGMDIVEEPSNDLGVGAETSQVRKITPGAAKQRFADHEASSVPDSIPPQVVGDLGEEGQAKLATLLNEHSHSKSATSDALASLRGSRPVLWPLLSSATAAAAVGCTLLEFAVPGRLSGTLLGVAGRVPMLPWPPIWSSLSFFSPIVVRVAMFDAAMVVAAF